MQELQVDREFSSGYEAFNVVNHRKQAKLSPYNFKMVSYTNTESEKKLQNSI